MFVGHESNWSSQWELRPKPFRRCGQRGIPLAFDFWNEMAGFEINQALIPYGSLSTYGQAFWVGVANTLLVERSFLASCWPPYSVSYWDHAPVAQLDSSESFDSLCEAHPKHPAADPAALLVQRRSQAAARAEDLHRLTAGIYLNNRGIMVPEISAEPSAGVTSALAAGAAATDWPGF